MIGDPLVAARPLLETAQQQARVENRLHERAEAERLEVVVPPAVERVQAGRGGVAVVEEEHAARPQRRRDAGSPALGRAEPLEAARSEIDEVPVAEEELRRQRVRVRVHPGHLRRALPCTLERGLVLVDPRDERAEAAELDRLAAGAAEQVQDAAAADPFEPLADRTLGIDRGVGDGTVLRGAMAPRRIARRVLVGGRRHLFFVIPLDVCR